MEGGGEGKRQRSQERTEKERKRQRQQESTILNKGGKFIVKYQKTSGFVGHIVSHPFLQQFKM